LFAGIPASLILMLLLARRTLARLKEEAEKEKETNHSS